MLSVHLSLQLFFYLEKEIFYEETALLTSCRKMKVSFCAKTLGDNRLQGRDDADDLFLDTVEENCVV